MGYTNTFFFVICDYEHTSNTLIQQLAKIYNATSLYIIVESSWYVRMQHGYCTGSDEIVKTNVKPLKTH